MWNAEFKPGGVPTASPEAELRPEPLSRQLTDVSALALSRLARRHGRNRRLRLGRGLRQVCAGADRLWAHRLMPC